ncbi:PQQ-dependent sugar dehydrogenase [uncultured Hymenobacter sp.]|uniref:PQQ-dependent sugar dehydrogenase n=1 Tax=uncultured Hymenobacter sp. TaxID=170016 RepID=UPI0035C9FC1E
MLLAVISLGGLLTAYPTLGQASKPAPTVKLQLVSDQLSHPTAFAVAPGSAANRLFVCEQEGRIRILDNGKLRTQPFLDISQEIVKRDGYDERGLLGLAFHPDYAKNGKFYLYCSTPAGGRKGVDNQEEVREYTVSTNGELADKASRRTVLRMADPESNHNGGDLKFGPDGYLYITVGDGGGQHDQHGPIGNAQNLGSLMGKILRLDINQPPYRIPPDNPFAGKQSAGSPAPRPEIYAYGFRNPWRISFDRKTGRLFAGDVGQDKFEEVDIVEKGANYGWRVREGLHAHNEADPDPKNWLNPISEYAHAEGLSITGGFVYRGQAIPALTGKYIFADWSGPIWQLTDTGNKTWTRQKLPISRTAGYWHVYSFGEDNAGELYLLTVLLESGKGALYKIVP